MGCPLGSVRGWSGGYGSAGGKADCMPAACLSPSEAKRKPSLLSCRGLEELQVEREEVIESSFRGDVNDVDDLDRIFG